MKWNILVIRGKKTNKYYVSTGEGMRIIKIIKNFWSKELKKNIRIIFNITKEGYKSCIIKKI